MNTNYITDIKFKLLDRSLCSIEQKENYVLFLIKLVHSEVQSDSVFIA